MITWLASVPPAAIAVTNIGWSWSATMGLVQNFILGGGAALGIGGLIVRATVQLKRIANERAKQDAERDGVRWKELLEFSDRLQKRVDNLEAELRDERRRCEDEMRSLHERIEALQKSLFQHSASTGNLITLPANAPTTAAKLKEQGA